MDIRATIRQVKNGERSLSEFFEEMAAGLPNLHVPVHGQNEGGKPVFLGLEISNLRTGVIFTDAEAAAAWDGLEIRSMPGATVLRTMMRSQIDVLCLNPGAPEQLVLKRQEAQALYRNYVLKELTPSALLWAPVKDDRLMAAEIEPGVMACALYFFEDDARLAISDRQEVEFKQVTWPQVWDRLLELSADLAFVQMGLPDAVMLTRREIGDFCGDQRRTELDLLEDVLKNPRRTLTDLLAVLPLLDRIWILVDAHEDVLGGEQGVDLFTSSYYALYLAHEVQPNAPEHPGIHPLLLPFRTLAAVLAEEKLSVWFNRGQAHSWRIGPEVLSAVLDRMMRWEIH